MSDRAGGGPPGREAGVPPNATVVRRFFEELWSAGRTDLVEELLGPEHVHHVVDTDLHGRDAVREMADRFRRTFPDLRFEVDDLIESGDKVVVRWTANATHEGALDDLPATGRRVSWTGIDILRLEGSHIVEVWASADAMGLWEQLAGPDPSP